MGILNMCSKEVLMWMKETIIRLKKQNRPIRETLQERPYQLFGTFLKRREALLSSAPPKNPEDHGRQLPWMVAEFFPWWKNHHLAKSRTLSRRSEYQCQSLQPSDGFMSVTAEGLSQDEKHRWCSGRESPDYPVLESLLRSGTRLSGRVKPWLTHSRIMGREEHGDGKEELMIQNTSDHQLYMVDLGVFGSQWSWVYWWCDCWWQ